MVSSSDHFNIAHYEHDSLIYGPGKRFVVWFQGCNLACQGCWNKQMWSFKPNKLIHREDLLAEILSVADIRGITLLGGEPLLQAENVWWLLEQVRRSSDLTVFLYTGFEAAEIVELGFQQQIEELCDIIALGRYDESSRNIDQQWIGSDNQQVIYPAGSRELDKPQACNQAEIIINDVGAMTILGFPSAGLIQSLG